MARVVVIGGGSAGVGAAWRAALCGAEVTLIEGGAVLGGASTLGGVHCWEPGIASNGLNRVLYDEMRKTPHMASVGRTLQTYTRESHIGLNGIDEALPYEATLRRGSLEAMALARVHFEPAAMINAMRKALETAGVKLVMNTLFTGIIGENGHITGVKVQDAATGEISRLYGDCFIDCTADAVVCRKANVPALFGEDSKTDFGEPCAPESRSDNVNGVSLCFRVSPGAAQNELPAWVYDTEAAAWLEKGALPASNVNAYPNGDMNFNPLPLMEGAAYFALPPHERNRALTARLYLYWEWMKKEHGFDGWHITEIMPRAGVRESWRVRTAVMTTELDLRKGYRAQGDDIIALGDHTLDLHSARRRGMKLSGTFEVPYGIRAGSLIVNEWDNLLVAGRCAGFSHLAASSCRLSRTMMDTGEASGALASQGGDMRSASVKKARQALRFDEYLDWVEKSYFKTGIILPG